MTPGNVIAMHSSLLLFLLMPVTAMPRAFMHLWFSATGASTHATSSWSYITERVNAGAGLVEQTSRLPLYTAIGLLTAFMVVLIIFAFRAYKRNQALMRIIDERNTTIEKQKKEMDAALEEMRRLKDHAETANQAKSMFLANMSHEIRTPLNGLLGLLGLLRKSKLSDEQQELTREAERVTGSLMATINDVLDYSKIESDMIYLDQVNFNMIHEISEVLQTYKQSAHDKQLQLISKVDPEIPIYVKGDPVRLKQVLGNLLSNAVKFTDQGSIRLHVELVSQQSQAVEVKFRVTDTGKGIDETEQSLIWSVFHLGDDSYTRQHGGAGLGLTISRKLVSLMQGSMGVNSRPDEGSSFWFTIRLMPGVEPDLMNMRHYKKVLLAEDNLINQKVAAAGLKNLGFDVDIAENGQVAVEKFKANAYDLILMDIQMPVMDGITATKAIRKIEKEKKLSNPVHIIAITANSLRDDRMKCIEAGMDDYLSKPFNMDKFPLILSQKNDAH